MKKILLLAALFAAPLFPAAVHAAPMGAVWDKGYSTFTVVGVLCTTGTTVNLTATRRLSTFEPAEYVIFNSSNTVYIGSNVNVSTWSLTTASLANFGFPIPVNTSRSFRVGRNPDLADQAVVNLYCQSADAGGFEGRANALSIMTLGYK